MPAKIELSVEQIEIIKNNNLPTRKMAELVGCSQTQVRKYVAEIKGEDYVYMPCKNAKPKKLSEEKNRTKSSVRCESIFEEQRRHIKEAKDLKGMNELTE